MVVVSMVFSDLVHVRSARTTPSFRERFQAFGVSKTSSVGMLSRYDSMTRRSSAIVRSTSRHAARWVSPATSHLVSTTKSATRT